MCGICGYVGLKEPAAPILRKMLVTMEKYRLGYESAGIATVHNRKIHYVKDMGSVSKVFPSEGSWLKTLQGSVGIGHVRYPSPNAPVGKSIFAHPFLSCDGKIVLVHNGAIFNYEEILSELPGHVFSSLDKTSNSLNDSEIIVHVLEEEAERAKGHLVDAVKKTCRLLSDYSKNVFLFAFISLTEPEKIYVVSGKEFENKRRVCVAFKEGFGSIFASYRDDSIGHREPIKFKAIADFVSPKSDRVEVLDYDTLAVLTKESYQIIPLKA